jgi:hypothetical protein
MRMTKTPEQAANQTRPTLLFDIATPRLGEVISAKQLGNGG